MVREARQAVVDQSEQSGQDVQLVSEVWLSK